MLGLASYGYGVGALASYGYGGGAVSLLDLLIIKVAFTAKQPNIAFMTKGASINFTAKQPSIMFTKVDC